MPLMTKHLNLYRSIKRLKNPSFVAFDRFFVGKGQVSTKRQHGQHGLQQSHHENASKSEACLSNHDRQLDVSKASVITSIHC